MSPPGHRIRHTYDEYLSLESASNTRHEFLDGQIYAMSGGTPEHAALIGAMIRALQLPAGCRAYPSDLRVRTRSGLTTYPDITVVCRRPSATRKTGTPSPIPCSSSKS
ncbi:MAG TPA: Uma2 family endonuclease [Thermoanaerobaculia bacterium]|jgi:Uma2 family endonuclease